MDPLTAPVVLAALKTSLDSASGQAGVQAWQSFVSMVQRKFGKQPLAVESAEAGSLAEQVVEAARQDPALAAELRSWLMSAQQISVQGGVTINTIEHGATVTGIVIQARNIGGTTFN